MKDLVDTNVLVRTAHVGHSDQALAIAALERLRNERHELTHLLTFNVEHFRRFAGVELLDPKSYGAPAP